MKKTKRNNLFFFLTLSIILIVIFIIVFRLLFNPINGINKNNSLYPSPTVIFEYIVITDTPIPTNTPKPTMTPTPTKIIISSGQFEEWFTKYANSQSINRELLKKIAVCESNLNPQATNGIYAGLYQFSENLWRSTRRLMNQDQSPALRFHPEEAIKTAAYKIAVNGASAWPNCGK